MAGAFCAVRYAKKCIKSAGYLCAGFRLEIFHKVNIIKTYRTTPTQNIKEENNMMNEKLQELLEKLGIDLVTNHSMTTDELLDCIGCTVDDEGEIIDENGKATGIWYEEIEY